MGRTPTPFPRFPPKRPPVPMALRVTRPTARTTADPRAAATAALAREDLAAYRALFAEAAEQTDVHARYGTRRALLEAGLAGLARETPKAVAQRFAVVA